MSKISVYLSFITNDFINLFIEIKAEYFMLFEKVKD